MPSSFSRGPARLPARSDPGGPPFLSVRDVLERLVAFDTVSDRPNAPAVDWISAYLNRPRIEVERQPGPEPGKVNLVARIGPTDGGGGREGLTLSGHLDVVPADPAGWESDPFRMVEREGRYVGRGACDMKGFCALAIDRLARLDPEALVRPLALLLTYDEEVGCVGARRFAQGWPSAGALPRNVIVGEPTSLVPVRLHKGHLRMRVRLAGKAAHTGTPHLGVNAIEPARHVLDALAGLRARLEGERSEHGAAFPDVPHAVLAVTGIRGGEASNVVPSACEIDVGIRVMPGTRAADLAERVRAAVEAAPTGVPAHVEVLGENPPMLTRPDAPVHRVLRDLTGREGDEGAPFASDGGWLSRAGYECVLFGPGSMKVAHRPDEFIEASELEAAGRILDDAIARLCLPGSG